MPAKNKASKKHSKRLRQRSSGFEAVPSIFPDRMRGKQAWSGTYNFAPVASAVGSTVLRLNSVYDPDYSGVGSTAYSFTQLAAVYGRYRVVSAVVNLDIYVTGSAAMTAFAVASPATTLGTSFADIVAQRHVWTAPVVGGGQPAKKRLYITTAKVYGTSEKAVMMEDDYCGLSSGNPNNGTFLHLGFFNPTAGALAGTITARIVYDVEWSLPLKQSA
jgi:hypothetical protein